MYEIKFTADAVEDLRWFGKVDRKSILAALESQLGHEPAVETRNRKRLRPNRLAEWELRIDRTRVFFDIDQANRLIQVRTIGSKRGSRLWIHGEEYEL
jgi:mRNA-degrading endonuclease RelE of RelBE toxin-antitoxin system